MAGKFFVFCVCVYVWNVYVWKREGVGGTYVREVFIFYFLFFIFYFLFF